MKDRSEMSGGQESAPFPVEPRCDWYEMVVEDEQERRAVEAKEREKWRKCVGEQWKQQRAEVRGESEPRRRVL